jgi:CheY-like chemotaxis protein
MKVLVVDPNAAERELTVRALVSEKHEVECVKDGVEALSAFEKRKPDVILIETTIVGISGPALVKRIRATEDASSHAFVVMTAAKTVPGDMKTCFGAGADDFVRKPIHREELLLRIDGATRIRAWAQRLRGAATVDLTTSSGITGSTAWATAELAICQDVGDMLGMPLASNPGVRVMGGATIGAQLPLTMVSENFEVLVAIAVDAASATALAGALLGDPEAAESDVRDMLREMTNLAAGSFKRTAGIDGRVLTTGLPAHGAPSTFHVERATARKEWLVECPDIGATLRFELQHVAIENKHLPVKSLREGMVLAHDLLNASGALLMRGGTRLTESHINQLPRALGDVALIAVMGAAA